VFSTTNKNDNLHIKCADLKIQKIIENNFFFNYRMFNKLKKILLVLIRKYWNVIYKAFNVKNEKNCNK